MIIFSLFAVGLRVEFLVVSFSVCWTMSSSRAQSYGTQLWPWTSLVVTKVIAMPVGGCPYLEQAMASMSSWAVKLTRHWILFVALVSTSWQWLLSLILSHTLAPVQQCQWSYFCRLDPSGGSHLWARAGAKRRYDYPLVFAMMADTFQARCILGRAGTLTFGFFHNWLLLHW